MGHQERSISNYINVELGNMAAYGQSKHAAKMASKKAYFAEHGNLKGWNPAKIDGKIYSKKTMETYKKAGKHFTAWLKEQGLIRPSQIDRTIASLYLKDREARGMSPWTISRDMAMINKVWKYDLSKAELGLKSRCIEDITRSRAGMNPKDRSLYEKYADQIKITEGCGTRRMSITIITKDDFIFNKEGIPVQLKLVEKNGRSRIAPILPSHRQAIKVILDRAPDSGPIFGKYSKNINNHYFRGEYAKELAQALQEKYAKTGKLDLDGLSVDYLVNLRGKDAMGDGSRYGLDKSVAGAVSGALGHNRLEVLKHYLY